MAGNAFPCLETEVQAIIALIPFFQKVHNPETLDVMFKASVILQQVIQGLLAGVSERGMAEVMGVGNGFTEVLIESKGAGESPGMLGHFQGMGKPRPVKIPFVDQEDLGFVLQILENLGVENAIPVPLKTGAVIVRFVAVQRPSHAFSAPGRIGGKFFLFRCFKKFPGCHEEPLPSCRNADF